MFYICTFHVGGSPKISRAVSEEGLPAFGNGFWVDANSNYVGPESPNAVFWIPPHAIILIEKREKV